MARKLGVILKTGGFWGVTISDIIFEQFSLFGISELVRVNNLLPSIAIFDTNGWVYGVSTNASIINVTARDLK